MATLTTSNKNGGVVLYITKLIMIKKKRLSDVICKIDHFPFFVKYVYSRKKYQYRTKIKLFCLQIEKNNVLKTYRCELCFRCDNFQGRGLSEGKG